MVEPSRPRPVDPLSLALLALRVAIVALAIWAAHEGRVSEDVERFREIAAARGSPYRDFVVEYAPLEVFVIRALGAGSLATLAGRVAAIAFVSDVAAWFAIRTGWGPRAARTYLLLGTPLLLFLYTRLDLVPVALAAWGAAWSVRTRHRASGIAFVAAILTKVWPVVIVPALWLRDRRAFWWATATAALGSIVWVVVGGVDGVRQVAGFRGATGWEVESVIGSIVWVVRDEPVRLEAGAPRVGAMSPGASVALAVLLVSLEVLIWTRAAMSRRDGYGGAAVAAVGALLICAPVFSLQYAAWLLPWAAVADADGDRRIVRLVAAIEILTVALFVLYSPDRLAVSKVAVLIRNALVIAVVFVWLRSTTAAPSPSSQTLPTTA